MCRLETEGAKYACGHYIITRELNRLDCNSPNCRLSFRHSRSCRPPRCQCEQFYGPDANETVIAVYGDRWCPSCEPWLKPQPVVRTR